MNSPPNDRLLLDLFRVAADKEAVPEGPHVADDLELLTCWSLGTLTASQTAQFTRHLANCGRCRNELADLLRAGVVEAPSESAVQGVDSHESAKGLETVVEVAPRILRFPGWNIRRAPWAMAAAAAVLVMIGTWWTMRPGSPDTIIAQADRSLAAGDFSGAFNQMDNLLQRTLPDDVRDKAIGVWQQSAVASARDRLKRGEFSGVEQIGDKAVRLGVKSPEIANLRLRAELKSTDDNALSHAGALLDYGYDLFGGRTRDVGDEMSPAEKEKITQGFQAALQDNPDDFTLHLNFGQFLLRQRQFDDARREFDRALALRPDDPAAHLAAGLVDFETKQPAAALEHFLKSIATDPKSAAAQIDAALALERLSRDREAGPYWRAAFELSSDPKLREELRPKLSPPQPSP